LSTILNRELAKGFLILNYLPKEVYKLENIDDLWNYILSELESKMSKPSYDTWLSNTYVKDFSNDILTISVENDFIKNWLVKRYTEIVNALLYEMTGSELEVRFQSEEEESDPLDNEKIEKKTQTTSLIVTRNLLNPKLSFDSFVVGVTNRFAHASCLAVAETRPKSYNPLFIYGAVGLGKTHLMHAIAHFGNK